MILEDSRDRYEHQYFRIISQGFLSDFVAVAREPQNPEFIYVRYQQYDKNEQDAKLHVFLHKWNWHRETGRHRLDLFESEIPAKLSWLRRHKGSNFYLLPEPEGTASYGTYLPLFHLVPAKTLKRFGLSPMEILGTFPMGVFFYPREDNSTQFGTSLQKAFAHHIWTHMDTGSKLSDHSSVDPISLLSHNLNFWLPYAYQVIEEEARSWGRVPCRTKEQGRKLRAIRRRVPLEATAERPLYGGVIWDGEEQAHEVTKKSLKRQIRMGGFVELSTQSGQTGFTMISPLTGQGRNLILSASSITNEPKLKPPFSN